MYKEGIRDSCHRQTLNIPLSDNFVHSQKRNRLCKQNRFKSIHISHNQIGGGNEKYFVSIYLPYKWNGIRRNEFFAVFSLPIRSDNYKYFATEQYKYQYLARVYVHFIYAGLFFFAR